MEELNAEERELLIAATKDGELYRTVLNEGKWIKAGGQAFPATQNDPAITASYFEAQQKLIQRGYVVHETGDLFMLTSSGFKKARELIDKEKEEEKPAKQFRGLKDPGEFRKLK